MIDEQKYIGTVTAAERAGLSASKLAKDRVFGTGCPYIKVGRRVLYDVDDLDAWLDSHKRRSTSAPSPRGPV